MTSDDAPSWFVEVMDLTAALEGNSVTVAMDTYMVRGVGLQPDLWAEARDVGRKAVTRSVRRAEKQLGIETLVEIIDDYDGHDVLDDDAEAAAPDYLTNGTPPADEDADPVDTERLADALEALADDDDQELDAGSVQATLEDGGV